MEQYAVMVVLGLVSETIQIPNKSLTWILFFIGLFVEIPPFVFFFWWWSLSCKLAWWWGSICLTVSWWWTRQAIMITSSWGGNVIYNSIITVIGVNYSVRISCCLLSSNIFCCKIFFYCSNWHLNIPRQTNQIPHFMNFAIQ